jgi:hypothetical protein
MAFRAQKTAEFRQFLAGSASAEDLKTLLQPLKFGFFPVLL